MKKVSIIVPVYNVCMYLEQISECLINQTYKNLEIILVDDGSFDGSSDVCDELSKKDKRIKVIHQKNGGVSSARNTGLKAVTGDYISFVDADDYISLNMIEILYNNLKNTDSDISVCNYLYYKETKPDFTINNASSDVINFNKIEALKDLISDGVLTNFLWNKLFKKELFEDILFPVGKIYEDICVLTKIFEKAEKTCYDERKLYGYYNRSTSYVNTYTKEKNENYLEICRERYTYLLKYKNLKDDLENYRCFYIYSAFLQSAKSRSLDIIESSYMKKEHDVYRKNFKALNKNVKMSRKLLYYLLFINEKLFYKAVTLVK